MINFACHGIWEPMVVQSNTGHYYTEGCPAQKYPATSWRYFGPLFCLGNETEWSFWPHWEFRGEKRWAVNVSFSSSHSQQKIKWWSSTLQVKTSESTAKGPVFIASFPPLSLSCFSCNSQEQKQGRRDLVAPFFPLCLVKPEEVSLSLYTHLEEFREQSLFWQLKIYCSFLKRYSWNLAWGQGGGESA